MAGNARLGIKCKLYRNSATYATPTWVEVTCIGDLSVGVTWDEGDASTRGSRIKKSAKTQLGLELTGTIQVSVEDANYIAIQEALHTDEALDLLVLNGLMSETGVTGYRADFLVTAGTQDQGRGAVLYDAITLKPGATINEPQRAEVVAGAPVFTAI